MVLTLVVSFENLPCPVTNIITMLERTWYVAEFYTLSDYKNVSNYVNFSSYFYKYFSGLIVPKWFLELLGLTVTSIVH